LLREAWGAGKVSRLTLVLGLIVSAAWAVVVTLVTVRFIVDTIREPALVWAYKVVLLPLLSVVVLFLVVFMPTQWLMYALLRLLERKRKTSGSQP
jgi:hypothetical protein